jgi:hypothetical protein
MVRIIHDIKRTICCLELGVELRMMRNKQRNAILCYSSWYKAFFGIGWRRASWSSKWRPNTSEMPDPPASPRTSPFYV